MTNSFQKLPLGTEGFRGYVSNPANAKPYHLSYPSQNCFVTDDAKAESRAGYRSEFSIGVDGSPATCIYHKTYDVAFFALGTKVFYRDFTTNQTYDTGLTLTAGTTTRFEEWFGNILLTNTTDGMRMIFVGRLNGAVSAGASSITVDLDLGGRLSAFSAAITIASRDLIVNGVANGIASVTVSTGAVALDGTTATAYADNTVCLVAADISSGLEKFSKVMVAPHSRLYGMGFPSATNADQPNNTVLTGKFVIGTTGASGIEDIISMPLDGTGGSVKITVSTGGQLTNILSVKDYIYFLTEDKIHATAKGDITTSGTGIGGTIPDEKDENHGCLNEDTACVIGNSEIAYITSNRRIIRLQLLADSGTLRQAPDESFDVPVKAHVEAMDKDQTGALAYHYRGQRKTIFQVRISGQWYWLVYDHNLKFVDYDGIVHEGAWQPPQLIAPVRGFFERNGVLYGTDISDDTVYSFFTTFTDNQTPIYSVIATGNFNVGNAKLKTAQLSGDLNQPSQINIHCYVTNQKAGRRPGSAKVVRGTSYTYDANRGVGALAVGSGGVGEFTPTASWNREFGVFPSQATLAQLVLENQQDGGYFSLNAFQLSGDQFPNSFSKAV